MSLDTSPFLNNWVEQDVSYITRDLLIYAQGIGCTELNYVYEHDNDFAAFPTFPIVLLFKGTEIDVVDFPSEFMRNGPKGPPFKGVVTGVDGERYMEMINPVPTEVSEEMYFLLSVLFFFSPFLSFLQRAHYPFDLCLLILTIHNNILLSRLLFCVFSLLSWITLF